MISLKIETSQKLISYLIYIALFSLMCCKSKESGPKPPIIGTETLPDEFKCSPSLFEFKYSATFNTGEFTNFVNISEEGEKRVIISNSIPNHLVGPFFNESNPFNLAPTKDTFYVDLAPAYDHSFVYSDGSYLTTSILETKEGTEYKINQPKYAFGIALNGVLFDPGADEPWRKHTAYQNYEWVHEALVSKLGMDDNNAHLNIISVPPSSSNPHPPGQYHYHGVPTKFIEWLKNHSDSKMTHVGFAADGFPIYYKYGFLNGVKDGSGEVIELKSSWQLKEELRPGGINEPCGKPNGAFLQDYEYIPDSGDLDKCNGRNGWTEEFEETYYYVITDEFPTIPRCFIGTPDNSFKIELLPPPHD